MFYNYYSDIMELKNIDIWLTNFLMSIGIWGYVLSCFLILIESMLPILPLSVFITILFYKLGSFIGFIISYIFTVLGCLISYGIFSTKLKKIFDKFLDKKDRKKLKRITKSIKKIKFENLCLIIALPFTPAFMVNIAAGLCGVNRKKYFYALLIGKIFLVIFWGFIGTSLLNSIKNPINLIYISILLILCFIVSKYINKKEGLE